MANEFKLKNGFVIGDVVLGNPVNRVMIGSDDYKNATDTDILSGLAVGKHIHETVNKGTDTGVVSGCVISINGTDNKLLDISAGEVLFVDYSDPTMPVYTLDTFDSQIGVDPTLNIRSKFVCLELQGGIPTVVFKTNVSPLERRSFIILGKIFGPGDLTITGIGSSAYRSWGVLKTLEDLMQVFGSLNISGNKYDANGTNLLLDKTSGTSFRYGANYATVPESPNILIDSEQLGITTYQYHLQGVPTTTLRTAIDPDFYDLNGVRTAVPNNKFTYQEIYYFPKGENTHVVYGQSVYNNIDDAILGIQTNGVILNTDILDGAILRAYVITQRGTTSLSDPTDARIIEATAGGMAGSGTKTSYTAAEITYDNTISGLTALDVQAAIDELQSEKLNSVTTDITLSGDGTPPLAETNITRIKKLLKAKQYS